MALLKRYFSGSALLLLALGLVVGTAQAKQFSLIGGGGQFHIGNGLMLPIQQAATAATTTTMFPNLQLKVVAGAPVVTGTLTKTVLLTGAGPKQGYQRKLVIPPNVLTRAANLTTVGVKFSNPTLFAVATSVKYQWPSATAVFSTGNAPPATISAQGGDMFYSNTLGQRFGGPAAFALSPGAALGGNYPGAPITLYIKVNAAPTGTPACTHPTHGGTDAACVAGVILVYATGDVGVGGNVLVTTLGTPAAAVQPTQFGGNNNIAGVKMGLTPKGTMLQGPAPPGATQPFPVLVALTPLPTNMASSQGGPWTTGQIIISNPAALGGLEKFTLSGMDSRTINGGGTIQLVSGALSSRMKTGPNANRGWVSLTLSPALPTPTPTMSRLGLAATIGLLLLTFGYATRRWIFA